MLSESSYNIPSKFKHILANKDCKVNKIFVFLVKIAGSFPFGAVVQPEEICKALASVVAMFISCKYFQFQCQSPPPPFINTLFSPGVDHPSACLTNYALWTSFSRQLCTTT